MTDSSLSQEVVFSCLLQCFSVYVNLTKNVTKDFNSIQFNVSHSFIIVMDDINVITNIVYLK